jgi:CHAT domain-containing protein
MTRAFLFGGARSVVATLWEVSGESSAALMADFYGALAQNPRDRASTLAEAKRRMISGRIDEDGGRISFSHPYFWSAYVMTGDTW